MGLPGSLPVVNETAVRFSISLGLALGCSIAPSSRFARKNYFYPDLGKNYQISQYDEPIAFEGQVEVELDRRHGLRRPDRARAHGGGCRQAHARGRLDRPHPGRGVLARRLQPRRRPARRDRHEADLRRGAPRARARRRVRAGDPRHRARLGISEARMERGNLRCDANVSLRPRGQEKLGTRTETKNVNSMRSVERAVRYEIQRQAAILAAGGTITQETRHWHEDTGTTSPGRPKSDADDYRYFPEPDLLPVAPSSELVESLRAALPEPPAARRRRLKAEWGFADIEFQES
jgi:aspartyl-tRNA(Asn)/glutamyl-tRNA(Gln) amidotransferase subunit B